jgi:hypothetical protein
VTVWCATPGCLPRGADGPAPAADGHLLCRHHIRRIVDDALRLAQLHDELGAQLAMTGGGAGVAAGGTHAGLRLDVAAAAARHDIRALLVELTQAVAAIRGGVRLPIRWHLAPALPPGAEGPRNIVGSEWDDRNPTLAAIVGAHAGWLAARPNAGDTSDRLGYLRRRAYAITTAEPVIEVYIGPCPMLVLPGTPCKGAVRALVRRTDALLPLQVTCEDPEHAWPVEELARLGRWIGLKRGRWMSAAELSVLYALPIRRIHQLASIHRWRRTEDRIRPVLYSAQDAADTLRPTEPPPTGQEPALRLVGGRA